MQGTTLIRIQEVLTTSLGQFVKVVINDLKNLPVAGRMRKITDSLQDRIVLVLRLLELEGMAEERRKLAYTIAALCGEKWYQMPELVKQIVSQPMRAIVPSSTQPARLVRPVLPVHAPDVRLPGLPLPAGDEEADDDPSIAKLVALIASVLIAHESCKRFELEPIRTQITRIFKEDPPKHISHDAWKTIADILDLGLEVRQHIIASDPDVVKHLFTAMPLDLARTYLFGKDRSIFGALVTEVTQASRSANKRTAQWFVPQAFMALNAFEAIWMNARNGEWELSSGEKQLCSAFLTETNELQIPQALAMKIRAFAGLYHGDMPQGAARPRPNGVARHA